VRFEAGRIGRTLSFVMTLGVSAKMQARLDEYGSFHRAFGNELCHVVGVPCIVAGAATLLGAVPLVTIGSTAITLAEVVSGAVIVFYLVSARLLGLVTGTLMALLVAGGRALPLGVGLVLFLGGWAVQFVGHAVYEKRSPAVLGNLLHLLVGPAWLVDRGLARLVPARE
jgi:uncharacterized membrane protein YGL010W